MKVPSDPGSPPRCGVGGRERQTLQGEYRPTGHAGPVSVVCKKPPLYREGPLWRAGGLLPAESLLVGTCGGIPVVEFLIGKGVSSPFGDGC